MGALPNIGAPVLAIQYAIERGQSDPNEALDFLEDWNVGDVTLWPEYALWLDERVANRTFVIDFDARCVRFMKTGAAVKLQPIRLRLLDLLQRHSPRVVRHGLIFDTLYALVGESAEPNPEVIKVHIAAIRHALNPHGVSIGCTWGVGYSLGSGGSQ